MTDRLVIEIQGDLPDAGKYAVLAAAEDAAKKLAETLNAAHDLKLVAVARSVRPGKKGAAATRSVVAPTVAPLTDTTVMQEFAADAERATATMRAAE